MSRFITVYTWKAAIFRQMTIVKANLACESFFCRRSLFNWLILSHLLWMRFLLLLRTFSFLSNLGRNLNSLLNYSVRLFALLGLVAELFAFLALSAVLGLVASLVAFIALFFAACEQMAILTTDGALLVFNCLLWQDIRLLL